MKIKLEITIEKKEDSTNRPNRWIVDCVNLPYCYGVGNTRAEAIGDFAENLDKDLGKLCKDWDDET